jgi:hypothetical protein
MKRSSLLPALFLWLPVVLSAQVMFRPGYIITNDHQKKECKIANYGSEHASMDYYYRFSRGDSALRIDIRHVEAFGVDDKRFFRARILAETSPEQIMADTVLPLRWEEKYVFIQLLFDGELASLYFFNDEGIYRFFLGMPDMPIEPLVYKRYEVRLTPNEPSSVLENNMFRTQLKNKLPCPSLEKELNKLHYNRKDLIDYLKKYHDCKEAGYHIYEEIHTGKLNFKAGLIVNRSTFQIDDYLDHYNFGADITFSGGLETEYLIPHNKYKLSLFAEGYYYSRNSSIYDATLDQITAIHFQYIEMPLGINYYFILKEEQKLFLRAAVVPNFFIGDSYMMFYNTANKYDLNTVTNLYLGAGYRFGRFSVEYRYYTRQNLTQKIYRRSSEHTRMSLVMKFSFWEPGK